MTRVRLTPILLALILAGCAATVPAPSPTPMAAPVTAPTQAMTAVGPVTARTLAPPYDTIRARPFDAGRMWTFDFPPLDYLERTYQFRPSQAWLDNVRLSALRFATWCSASFVSPQGLVLTNHHCSVPTFDDVQRTGEDFLTNGFYARTAAEERRVPGLFVEQLVSIEDVTPRLNAEMEGAGAEAERLSRQQALRRELEQPDSAARMRYQIVEFYNGGRYARYGYKRYDDVRLVFVPEQQIAFFGGDPDNFNYPRFALDMGLFRVYDEAGQALKPANYFRWSASGAELGEPVFLVGNPGSTQRQFTVAQLEYLRDVQQPAQLAVLAARRDAIRRIMQQDPVRGLELRDNLFSIENSIKAITGRVEGENDPALFARKVDFERSFRARIEASPELRTRYGTTWDSIATLQEARRRLAPGLLYTAYLSSGPLGQAVALVRAAGGVQQLRGVALAADDRAASEQVLELTYLLGAARDVVPEDSLLQMVLAGRTPEAAAQQIVSGYTLGDTAARRALLDGGTAALAASNDPVVAVARSVVPILEARQLAMAALQSRENLLRNRLGRGFYEVYGTDVPPDATFTLRLADGVIKGYEADGMIHPPFTTFFGLYNRAAGFSQRPPFDLPPRWQERPRGLNLETRFNFVSTNDIIGGNSGSPLVNRNSEVVGLAFDGNLQSLPGNFIFDETENRTISVHSAGMLEALRDVYRAARIVDELMRAR